MKKKYKVTDNFHRIGRKSFAKLVLYALDLKKQAKTSVDKHR